ncbi:CPBP family intramembrane glutamic endopeptidase [Polymorphospora lycopeni]|uniref:Type II CAAX endopeptidase family protein n=1 Tax=Polymorphospora lycopeni TaxID=3140240 RepID=A0ABV5CJJ1_9ACTN
MATRGPARREPVRPAGGRRLSVLAFVGLVVAYLIVLHGLALTLTSGLVTRYAAPGTLNEMWRGITLPEAVSVVLVVAVVSWLRWWPPVLRDDRPVQRWVVVVPIGMAACAVVVTDYAALAGKGAAFTLTLLLSAALIGVGEELMFRGLGVTVFRANGFREGMVALWSTVIFAVAHAANLLTEGAGAFVQVLTTMVAGYFLYLIRRRSGGIAVPAVIHAMWDFSLISGQVNPDRPYPLSLLAIVTMVVLAIVVLVRRHHIEPAPAPGPGRTR